MCLPIASAFPGGALVSRLLHASADHTPGKNSVSKSPEPEVLTPIFFYLSPLYRVV